MAIYWLHYWWRYITSNQQQIIEQARFAYSPLGKAFKKQIKTIEDQGEKQIKAIRDQGQLKTIKKIWLWCWKYSIYCKTEKNI